MSKKLKKKSTALAKTAPTELERIDAKLDDLAKAIAKHRDEAQGHAERLTADLVAMGKALTEARDLHAAKGVKGEGFNKWIEGECKFSRASAYNYIRLYETSKQNKKLLSMGVMDALVAAGIKKDDDAGPTARNPFQRGLEVEASKPSGGMRELSLSREDGFSLTMKLPEAGLDDYLTQRTKVVSAVKDELAKYLRELKRETKKASKAKAKPKPQKKA